MQIDVTKETAETLFKKLQLQIEFSDFVNINDYYSKSIQLQRKLNDIVFEMSKLSLYDNDTHISFLECAQPYAYELIELLNEFSEPLDLSLIESLPITQDTSVLQQTMILFILITSVVYTPLNPILFNLEVILILNSDNFLLLEGVKL